ncbi:MAG TPA: hypothetical protein VIH99_07510 [Bdellovibrionota bacterium]|jgi:hypothetical protein
MNDKDKAFKVAVTAIIILATLMFIYYWVSFRMRKTENDVGYQEKAEGTVAAPSLKDEKSDFTGAYSVSESIEGGGRRLGFFSVNKRDDGYFGSAKVDSVATTEDQSKYIPCNDVKIGEKDFFLKCSDPVLGQISFVGEWSKDSGGIQVSGKVTWFKDGNVLVEKNTSLTHTGG